MRFNLSPLYIKQFVVVAYTLQNAVEMVTISICYEYLTEAVARYELDNLLHPMGIKFVENIVAGKINAGQLDNSEISFKEISRIKSVLKSYLGQIYHDRVVYPK